MLTGLAAIQTYLEKAMEPCLHSSVHNANEIMISAAAHAPKLKYNIHYGCTVRFGVYLKEICVNNLPRTWRSR